MSGNLILDLIDRLPAPDRYWRVDDRAAWFRAMIECFNVVYKPNVSGAIEVVVRKDPTVTLEQPQ